MYLIFIIRSFLLAQKRTKKGNQSLGSAMQNFPALLETTGSLKTRTPLLRGAQTGQTPLPVASVVLGGVKWQKTEKTLIFVLSANPFRDGF